MLLRAWEEMHLSGVLTLNGIPTVYLRDDAKPVRPEAAAAAQLQFWNQGVATILLLRDPQHVRVYSSMMRPTSPATATDLDMEQRLVEKLDLAALASWAERFYTQIGNGHYYAGSREAKFDPAETVDICSTIWLPSVMNSFTAGWTLGMPMRSLGGYSSRVIYATGESSSYPTISRANRGNTFMNS
jgi:hypothetical protein